MQRSRDNVSLLPVSQEPSGTVHYQVLVCINIFNNNINGRQERRASDGATNRATARATMAIQGRQLFILVYTDARLCTYVELLWRVQLRGRHAGCSLPLLPLTSTYLKHVCTYLKHVYFSSSWKHAKADAGHLCYQIDHPPPPAFPQLLLWHGVCTASPILKYEVERSKNNHGM